MQGAVHALPAVDRNTRPVGGSVINAYMRITLLGIEQKPARKAIYR